LEGKEPGNKIIGTRPRGITFMPACANLATIINTS
jgi:hypothetical protein